MKEIFSSKHHDIRIESIDWDEPNNGRMLRIADLIIHGENANKKYFQDWNRLDQRLEKYTIDSNDGKFVFIPSEAGGFLINTLTLEKQKLPYKGVSTVTFLGNSFHKNLLILIHIDEIIICNLFNSISTRIHFTNENINWAELNDNDDVVVTYYDKQTKTLKSEIFDFKSQATMKNAL